MKKPTGERKFWNPSVVFQLSRTGEKNKDQEGKNLLAGTKQLLEAIGLGDALAEDSWQILKAVFEFRNKTLHHGYEWPDDERMAFVGRIREMHWENWFYIQHDVYHQSDQPWLIWATDSFAKTALDQAKEIASELQTAIGRFGADR